MHFKVPRSSVADRDPYIAPSYHEMWDAVRCIISFCRPKCFCHLNMVKTSVVSQPAEVVH